jgi:hypothetical protein
MFGKISQIFNIEKLKKMIKTYSPISTSTQKGQYLLFNIQQYLVANVWIVLQWTKNVN